MAAIDKESLQIVSFGVMGYALQYACNIYVARLLPASDYGDFALAVSILLVLATATEIGASKTIPKYIHQYKKNKDYARITGLLRGYILVPVLLAFLVTLFGGAIGYLDLEIAHKADSDQLHPLILALAFLPLITPSNILASSLKCINRRVNSELPRLSLYGLTLLFIWLYGMWGFQETDWSGIALFGVANIVVLLIYIVLAFQYVPRQYVQTMPQYEWREWLHTSLPIMASSILFVGTRQADLFMVEALDPNEAHVGFFAAGSQTAQGLIIIYVTLNLLYGSRIGEAITRGKDAVNKALRKMAGFMACFCLAFLLFSVFCGKQILGLFGPDYIEAYPAMLLLILGASSRVISGGYITFLQYSGKQNYVLAVQFGALLLSMALNIILIPRLGMLGAGISSAACFMSMSIFLTFRAQQLLRKMA